jgi:hypothetical protein
MSDWRNWQTQQLEKLKAGGSTPPSDTNEMRDPEKVKQASKKHYEKTKEYYLERNRKLRAVKAEYIRKLREAACDDCHHLFPWYVMEFDHREDRKYDISPSLSWSRLKTEIAKCDIVCANCHSIRTHNRRTSGS